MMCFSIYIFMNFLPWLNIQKSWNVTKLIKNIYMELQPPFFKSSVDQQLRIAAYF